MAIDSILPSIEPPSGVSTSSSMSTSSSLSPFGRRKRLVQVATNNSATFIQFPTNARQPSSFVPICRPRTSLSATRLSTHATDTQSLSNQSKSSAHAATPSIDSSDHKRSQSKERINPILNNPLLNHRKEQPKTPPVSYSNTYSYTTRLCLSSKPSKTTSNDNQMPAIRASTAPILAPQKETNINVSDRLITPIDNKTSEQQMQYVDENKYDYITRWLNEVRAATYSNETFPTKSKRTKRRVAPS